MNPPIKPIVFFTNSEYGQANVILAVAQEIATNSGYQVYIAASVDLEQRIANINKTNIDLAHQIRFLPIPGVTISTILQRNYGVVSAIRHEPGFFGGIGSYKQLGVTMLDYSGAEYLEGYLACLKILEKLKPRAVICEIGLWVAHDAARFLDLDYITMAPVSAKDFAGPQLPGAPSIFKWPAMSSGFQYPLSLLDKVKNILMFIWFAVSIMRGPSYARLVKNRKDAGLKHDFPVSTLYREKGLYICPYIAEADYNDFPPIPKNIVGCGPIMVPSLPLTSKASADLLSWISKRETILINLGTHMDTDPESAVAISKGVKNVLEAKENLQVLWKLRYKWEDNPEMAVLVKPLIEAGTLQIRPWLDIDPPSLLENGKVVCAVHHGGANSYYEACRYVIFLGSDA